MTCASAGTIPAGAGQEEGDGEVEGEEDSFCDGKVGRLSSLPGHVIIQGEGDEGDGQVDGEGKAESVKHSRVEDGENLPGGE